MCTIMTAIRGFGKVFECRTLHTLPLHQNILRIYDAMTFEGWCNLIVADKKSKKHGTRFPIFDECQTQSA